jgi:hypothetical protein
MEALKTARRWPLFMSQDYRIYMIDPVNPVILAEKKRGKE